LTTAPATRHQYHFEDLSPDEFERLVYCLVERSGKFDVVQGYGGMGDKGRDVIAYRHSPAGREKWYIQCKRYETISFYHLKRELNKLAKHAEDDPSFAPDAIVFATATTPSPQAKDDATDHAKGLGLPEPYYWGRMELDTKLKAQPETVEEFFGRLQRPTVPVQLPPLAEHFTGRERELEELLDMLQPGRVVTLCGPGGIGKTALAAEALGRLADRDDNQLTERFPDGVVFHTFYNQPKTPVALESIARAYGEDPSPSPAAAARRVLAGRRALLILDGTENADDLPAVLGVRSSCGVLVTTRARHDAAGDFIDLTALDTANAVDLLLAWGGARACNQAAVERICTLVGGLPLAVRLVGRYLVQREEEAEDYLGWLEETPLTALDQGERQLDSVPVLLNRSVAQLGENARRALGVVGLLALSPFGREPIVAALKCSTAEAGRKLGDLVDYGLLRREPGKDGRYEASHALIHTYARQRQEDLGLPSDSVERLADFYTDLTREQSQAGPAGYAVLDRERSHLLTVLDRCASGERSGAAEALSKAMDEYLNRFGHWTDRVAALQTGLTAVRALGKEAEEGQFLGQLGTAYYRLGEWDRAIEYCQKDLEISQRVGASRGVG
jgi:hypothetical protein